MSILIRLLVPLIVLCVGLVAGEAPKVVSGVAYKSGELTALERERCVLDLYLPEGVAGKPFPTLVWFHGGGLTEGTWNGAFTVGIAKAFARAGIAVVSAGYRLSPTVPRPGMLEDGAAAFASEGRFVDKRRAVMVGDKVKDAQAAAGFGIPCILLATTYTAARLDAEARAKGVPYAAIAPDLAGAVDLILAWADRR